MLKKVPNTYVIIFSIIIFAAVLTWLIPGGKYVKEVIVHEGVESEQVSFQSMENHPQTWQVFSALFNGFVKQAGIIVFILMVGGAFWILNSSKAIDVGIFSFLKFTKKLEKVKLVERIGINSIVITLIMLLFSLFGAIFGMSEETIAFIIILVPLAISMGYDSITGVAMVFVAAGLGFAGAILNPFTIGIAQELSGIPLFTGIEYRMFSWVVINVVGIAYVLRYAAKIRKTPSASIVYEEDAYWREKESHVQEKLSPQKASWTAWLVFTLITGVLITFSVLYPITTMKIGNANLSTYILPVLTALFVLSGVFTLLRSVHYFILLILAYTMLLLIVGVMGYDWYISEIATIFFAMGLAAGISMQYSGDRIVKEFMEGVKDIMSAAIVVGLAAGIIVVLEDGNIIDTILYKLSQTMDGLGKTASVSIMYGIQTIINIVIPSGSAKAALTMPIMAPFSDLIGVSRQATVMAFQFGDGFTNMITPTSGVLIAVLGVAKIPYEKWVKWITPLMIILMILGLLLLIPTVNMELNGF